jgi:hypothetical protein
MARTLTRRRSTRDTEAYTPADEPDESLHTEEASTSSRKSRRSREEEPEEDKEPTPKVGGKGWGTYEKTKQATSSFPDNFKVTNEQVLIKILDEEPFLVFLQHWIERKGKRSWTCLESRCPLCDDAGDKPSQQVSFNVVDFTDPDDPQLKVWQFGPMVADILKNFSKDKKTSPINRADLYFAVSKETKNNKTTYFIVPVKERDLGDDWDTDPLTDDDLDEFDAKAYDEDVLHVNTRSELKTIASEILND